MPIPSDFSGSIRREPPGVVAAADFQFADDARRFMEQLSGRLEQFGLDLATEKTRRMEFGRFARSNATKRATAWGIPSLLEQGTARRRGIAILFKGEVRRTERVHTEVHPGPDGGAG